MGLRRSLSDVRHLLKKDGRKPRAPRRGTKPVVEVLEDRITPSAMLWVDFGDAFPGGGLTVTDDQMKDSKVNGPSNDGHGNALFGGGYTLIPLSQSVISRNLDFNGDKVSDAKDVALLEKQVLADVSRAYEPFAVT